MRSSVGQKALASSVNVAVVFTASGPFFLLMPLDVWKVMTVVLFFSYNMVFRRRCLGMMLVGTFLERPASIAYIALYTLSFSTIILLPLEWALAYCFGVQLPCVLATGNTLHGWLCNEGSRVDA